MTFKFKPHPCNCHGSDHFRNLVAPPLFDVFTSSGQAHLGFVAKSKNNQKKWVAGPKSVTRNVVLKRGFQSKQDAAEYLYDIAMISSI